MTERSSPSAIGVEGFTLIEALVATGLLGLILAALSTIIGQWLPNWNRGFMRVQRYEHVAVGLERLIADLSAAEFVFFDQKTSQPYFYGTDQSITFVRSELGLGTGSRLEIIRVAEISSERGPMLIRTRAPFAITLASQYQPSFTDPIALVNAPFRLRFSYAGSDRVWKPTWRGEQQLPKAIQFTLRDEVTERRLSMWTVAPIHSELPAGCSLVKSPSECMSRLRPPSPQNH